MKRKVNLVGKNTLTISLPTEWTKKKGIRKGDELELVEEGEGLCIGGQRMHHPRIVQLRIGGGDHMFIRSHLGALFRRGVDEIHISFEDKSVIPELREALTVLMGCEYFPTGERTGIIRNIVDQYEFDIPPLMLKMQHIISAMHSIIIDGLQTGAFKDSKEIGAMRIDLLKYRNFIGRIITLRGMNDGTVRSQYVLASLNSLIGGAHRELYQYLCANPRKHDPKEVKLFQDLKEYYNDIVQLKGPLHKLHKRSYDIFDEAYNLLSSRKNTHAVSHVLIMLRLLKGIFSNSVELREGNFGDAILQPRPEAKK